MFGLGSIEWGGNGNSHEFFLSARDFGNNDLNGVGSNIRWVVSIKLVISVKLLKRKVIEWSIALKLIAPKRS